MTYKDKTYDQEGCPHEDVGIEDDYDCGLVFFCRNCKKEFSNREFDELFKIKIVKKTDADKTNKGCEEKVCDGTFCCHSARSGG